MRMVREHEQSGHHLHGHMHHHGGGHHHHGHLRHGHVVGHTDHLLGADDPGQEMVNIGLIGHLHHGRGGCGPCGHLRHRGRKVLGIVFHGGGHGPFGRHGGKQHGKHGRGHHGNKLNGHGHHGKHGHGHHGMQRKKNRKGHCCGYCLGGQEGTSVGQAILGQRDDVADTAVEATATQGQGGDAAATQLTSLLETQLVVFERES